MLRIRLTRVGKKNRPQYRIVVAEHTWPIKGKFIEILGFYNPFIKEKKIFIDSERVKYWLSKGAKFSQKLKLLLAKHNLRYD